MIFSSAILCGGSVCKWFSLFNYSSDFWLILEHCISNTFVLLPPFHLANVLFTHSFIRPISKTRGAGGVAALPLAKGTHHSTPWQMGKKRCRNTFAIDILLGNLSFRKLCEINSNTLSLWPPRCTSFMLQNAIKSMTKDNHGAKDTHTPAEKLWTSVPVNLSN